MMCPTFKLVESPLTTHASRDAQRLRCCDMVGKALIENTGHCCGADILFFLAYKSTQNCQEIFEVKTALSVFVYGNRGCILPCERWDMRTTGRSDRMRERQSAMVVCGFFVVDVVLYGSPVSEDWQETIERTGIHKTTNHVLTTHFMHRPLRI